MLVQWSKGLPSLVETQVRFPLRPFLRDIWVKGRIEALILGSNLTGGKFLRIPSDTMRRILHFLVFNNYKTSITSSKIFKFPSFFQD
ncbi:hypothetical protein Hanom_Chr05g00470351 [Helianthus anomalus]